MIPLRSDPKRVADGVYFDLVLLGSLQSRHSDQSIIKATPMQLFFVNGTILVTAAGLCAIRAVCAVD
jgi:hypothetical protein